MANAFNFIREQSDVKAGIIGPTDIGGVSVLHVAQVVSDSPAREETSLLSWQSGKLIRCFRIARLRAKGMLTNARTRRSSDTADHGGTLSHLVTSPSSKQAMPKATILIREQNGI